MSTLKFDALVKKYMAEIAIAKADLENYFLNSVGVAEHPSVIGEMDRLVEQIANAEGKMMALQSTINFNPEEEKEEGE